MVHRGDIGYKVRRFEHTTADDIRLLAGGMCSLCGGDNYYSNSVGRERRTGWNTVTGRSRRWWSEGICAVCGTDKASLRVQYPRTQARSVRVSPCRLIRAR